MIIDELKLLTNNLIKFKTVRPDNKDSETTKIFKDEINKCMGFVCKSLHKSIITDRADEYIYDESCPILIAKFHDREPDLLMVGHIDVVNGDESQFHPYEKDGKIYGRGAKDMKSGVAAMIEIMNHYAEKREKPNIAMAVVSDEESGGFNGSNIIVNKIGMRPEFVVTPDPGERHGIINKEKGFIWLTITIFGKSSHASRPWLGDCAYTKAFRLCQDILSKFNLSQSEDDWRTTASVTQIKKLVERSNCQDKFILDTSNAIAGVVKCSIDIRYTENDKIEEIKSLVNQIAKSYGERNTVEYKTIGSVSYTPVNNRKLRAFKAIVDVIEGADIPFIPSAGASDGRFFSEKKIPFVTYGPTGKNHHSKEEYVDIESIYRFYNVMIKYIDQYIL